MTDTFRIESPAQVPWQFHDQDHVLVGESPRMVVHIVHQRGGRHLVTVMDYGIRILASGTRMGLARAVAFALEAGDRYHCEQAPCFAAATSGSSSTASFSQVRDS